SHRSAPRQLDHFSVEAARREEIELLGALVVFVDRAPVGPGELVGASDDRVKHDLEVEGGTEGLADLAERLKLANRAGKLAGARLQLREQPRVLDGDGRLVGEGLHQSDVTVGEWPDLVAEDDDHPEQFAAPEHGNPK